MDEYEKKFQAAENELRKTGIWRSNAIPPYVRLERRLGFKPRPPHYLSFGRAAINMGVWFAFSWGTLMYLLLWRHQDMPIWMVLVIASFGGLMSGIFMASYYEFGRRAHKLSKWADL